MGFNLSAPSVVAVTLAGIFWLLIEGSQQQGKLRRLARAFGKTVLNLRAQQQ